MSCGARYVDAASAAGESVGAGAGTGMNSAAGRRWRRRGGRVGDTFWVKTAGREGKGGGVGAGRRRRVGGVVEGVVDSCGASSFFGGDGGDSAFSNFVGERLGRVAAVVVFGRVDCSGVFRGDTRERGRGGLGVEGFCFKVGIEESLGGMWRERGRLGGGGVAKGLSSFQVDVAGRRLLGCLVEVRVRRGRVEAVLMGVVMDLVGFWDIVFAGPFVLFMFMALEFGDSVVAGRLSFFWADRYPLD